MATGRMCSWAPEVLVSGVWSGNALRFATRDEAERNGRDLLMRWLIVAPTTETSAAIGVLMFKDTIVARMLRKLCVERAMPQSKFMNEYTLRCERPPSKWRAAEGKPATRSSFLNQFGRYVDGSSWGTYRYTRSTVPRVISQEQMLHPYAENKVSTLVWTGDDVTVILTAMSDRDLQRAYESMERQLTNARATDKEVETVSWLHMLTTEIERRSCATMECAA